MRSGKVDEYSVLCGDVPVAKVTGFFVPLSKVGLLIQRQSHRLSGELFNSALDR